MLFQPFVAIPGSPRGRAPLGSELGSRYPARMLGVEDVAADVEAEKEVKRSGRAL